MEDNVVSVEFKCHLMRNPVTRTSVKSVQHGPLATKEIRCWFLKGILQQMLQAFCCVSADHNVDHC